MKIEIELSEVENLRDKVLRYEKEIRELESKVQELDESAMKVKAVDLSKWLFDNYMECVFKGLGFDEKYNRGSVHFPDNVGRFLGKSWWGSERLTFEVSATVSNKFRGAFLAIGVTPLEQKEDELKWVN
jgi:hypothetical protein